VAIVSARDTIAMPNAPPPQEREVGRVDGGDGERREPLRQRPDELDPVTLEAERVGGRDRDDDRGEHARHPPPEPLQHKHHRERRQADREGGGDRLAVADAAHERPCLGQDAGGVGRESEQLGQLADQDRERQAGHVADHRGLGQQIGDEAEAGHGPERCDRTDEEAKHRRERDRPLRVALRAGDRQDDGGDHRPERRVRAEDEHGRGAEHGVAEQAQDRGVEPRDRRQPGQLGVRHALGHQQG
jgi:hypothetical protein